MSEQTAENDQPCPTCAWPVRETVNGVCQACGTNYNAEMPGKGDDNTVHVLPVGDAVMHDPADDCACGPASEPIKRADGSVGWVVTHHSLDGREAGE